MFENFKKVYFLLTLDLKNKIKLIFILLLFSMLLEALSIGMIVPVLSYFFFSNDKNTIFDTFISKLVSLSSLDTLTILLIMIFLIFTLKNFFLILNQYINSKFLENLRYQIALKRFQRYLQNDYKFFLNNNTSILLRNITTEIGSLVEFTSNTLILFAEFSVFIAITTLLLVIDFKSTLIVALTASIFGFLIIYLTKQKLLNIGKNRVHVEGEINKYFLQGLSAVKDVKLLKVEDTLISSAKIFLKKSLNINLFFRFLNGIIKYLFEILIVTLFISLIVLLNKLDVDYNSILKTCALFAVASFRILPSVSRISTSIQQIRFREKTIRDLYNEFYYQNYSFKNNLKIKNEKKILSSDRLAFKDRISVKNLSFNYSEKSKAILKNISFEIKKGEFLGIYGESGSGKTTLVNLMIGLLESEKIFCDNKSIFHNLDNWQKNIGYVAQDTYLIDDTIKNNIAFGIPSNLINGKKMSNCLEKSQLNHFIETLPEGIETVVGERGINISGGQKQRIGIARALYHDPDILFFDEATSALDMNTEQNLLSSIKELKREKTIIFVTHRQSIILECDKVLILEEKKIKYFGEPKNIN